MTEVMGFSGKISAFPEFITIRSSDRMSVIRGGFDDMLIFSIFCAGVLGSIVLLMEMIQESLQEEENSVY